MRLGKVVGRICLNTTYDTLVQVMDRTRVVEVNAGLNTVQAELFPDISMGDAPAPDAPPGTTTGSTAAPGVAPAAGVPHS